MPITLADQAGVVTDCHVLDGVSASDEPWVFNPDGNLSRLRVFFKASRCIAGIDAQLSVGPGGYDLVITDDDAPLRLGCLGPAVGVGLDLNVRVDISAATVHATLGQSPAQSPSPVPLACAIDIPVVVDETGLVRSCAATRSPSSSGSPFAVTNVDGDESRLVITWAEACSPIYRLTLRRSAQGFELEASWVDLRSVCDGMIIETNIELDLAAPIPADTVAIRYLARPIESSPSPTPSASPAADRTIDCSSAGTSPITFIDHGGAIASCAVQSGAAWTDDVTATSTIVGEERHLIVSWPHSLCGRTIPAELELWGPLGNSDLPNSSPHYVLQVSRLPGQFGPCSGWGDLQDQSVDLVLNADISADDIKAFLVNSAGPDEIRTIISASAAAGRFVLQMSSKPEGWAAGEPIQISTSLQYIEGWDKVTVVGQAVPQFGIEQLDGSLEIPPPPTILMCPADHPHVFQKNVEQKTDFRLLSGAGREQWSEYFRLYGYDDHFRLPAGTYRLYAFVDFFVGDNCQGDHVTVEGSVVIRVH
jgi:hypothetical protein